MFNIDNWYALTEDLLKDVPDDLKPLLSMYLAFTMVEKGVDHLQSVDLDALVRNCNV